MNSHLRRAAAACLFSTVPGWILLPEVALAQSAGPIRHADAFEELFEEPAARGDLGKEDRMPKKEDFSATGKIGGGTTARPNQKRFKRKVPAAAPAAATKEPAPPATANHPSSATPVEGEAVSQTAALQSRPFSAKKPQSYSATSQNGSSSSSSNGDPTTSDVERELQELYRKNGREMPDMRMDDFQTPQSQGAPPRVPGMRHGPSSTSDPGTQQPRIKPSKPNFMERVFGFGRGKKSAPAAPQPSRPTSQAVAPRSPGITPSSRPPQQYPPFRPSTPVTTPVPTSVPRVQPVPPAREPASIGPTSQLPGIQPPETLPAARAPQRLPGLQPRESMLMDESDLGGDDESLDLSQDEPQPESVVATPKAAPAATPAGSPYTGLTITPNETERSLARGEELPPTVNPAARPSAPAVPSANSFAEAPVVEPTQPKLPVLEPDHDESNVFPPPVASAPTKSNADDFLELADDDEGDDEDFGDKPKADEPLSRPVPDLPPEQPKPAAGEKPANKVPEKSTEKIAEKPAPAAPARPAQLPSKPAADHPATEKPVEKPAEKPAPSPPESLKGLKGFCPVILKDERRLVEARSQYKLDYRGKTYTFSSQEARLTFEANPAKYVPVEEGRDVVRLAGGNRDELDGTLEHAAWYRGRLYLFSSEETRREFVEAPSRFMRND